MQEQAPLWQALYTRAQQSQVAFHTPGHKGGRGLPAVVLEQLGAALGAMDLPELPELDNLFAPESVILDAQALAAELFGAEQTWFLTNGSTCGILAAILATCGPGDPIIMPRNIHQSVLSGLILSGAIPIFVEPDYDLNRGVVQGMTPEQVEEALALVPETKAILLVYPTYEGICSDIAGIVALAHGRGIPLLVDEAHGAHFRFHPDLPQSALAAGADLAVQSTHKVLGALTQAAMLHGQGDLIERHRVSQALQLVQSTSPNYLLLASLDVARQQMAMQGEALMQQVLALADRGRSHLQVLEGYPDWDSVETCSGWVTCDRTRLTVPAALLGQNGYAVDRTLIQTYGVTAELVTPDHLTFLISLGNTQADIEQLGRALKSLSQGPRHPSSQIPWRDATKPRISIPSLSPREAYWYPCESVPFQEAGHRICAEWICPYPPGIPVLLPGETVQPGDLSYLSEVKHRGGIITGCSDPTLQTLKVVRQ
ncbi:MAG: aminotransferase class I/II-fold pyridoxal phosphate-dependent enzyme [Acaryochloridaceae cyanobacterium CSU_3_4]|nr:aminotransferase class I/II-fold pyridoxal phosphate-dependent enzyme [Acaryochloridaceae cyanobacterium CSU_3_4]